MTNNCIFIDFKCFPKIKLMNLKSLVCCLISLTKLPLFTLILLTAALHHLESYIIPIKFLQRLFRRQSGVFFFVILKILSSCYYTTIKIISLSKNEIVPEGRIETISLLKNNFAIYIYNSLSYFHIIQLHFWLTPYYAIPVGDGNVVLISTFTYLYCIIFGFNVKKNKSMSFEKCLKHCFSIRTPLIFVVESEKDKEILKGYNTQGSRVYVGSLLFRSSRVNLNYKGDSFLSFIKHYIYSFGGIFTYSENRMLYSSEVLNSNMETTISDYVDDLFKIVKFGGHRD